MSARVMTQKLAERRAKPSIVGNGPGAAGSITAERAANTTPDGYARLFGGRAAVTTNVTIHPKLACDPLRDFAPIMNAVDTPNILVVRPSLPARTVQEPVALPESRPAEIASKGSLVRAAGAEAN